MLRKNHFFSLLFLSIYAQSCCSDQTLREYLAKLNPHKPQWEQSGLPICKYTIEDKEGVQHNVYGIYSNRMLLVNQGNRNYSLAINPHSSYLQGFPELTRTILGNNYAAINDTIENREPLLMKDNGILDKLVVRGTTTKICEKPNVNNDQDAFLIALDKIANDS